MRLLWTRNLPAPLRVLSLAREPALLFLLDGTGGLHRFSRAGEPEAQARTPTPFSCLACAEDGSGLAGGGAGQVFFLGADLLPRWGRNVPGKVTALALGPLGERLAVADSTGGLTLFTAEGHLVWRTTSPRPLNHLAFVAEQPVLVGAADYGLVAFFEANGQCRWRDGVMANVASLASSGDGSLILLACFSEGLLCYAAERGKSSRLSWNEPARLAALSYKGETVLVLSLAGMLSVRDRQGGSKSEAPFVGTPLALALDPLGRYGVTASAEGELTLYDTGLGK